MAIKRPEARPAILDKATYLRKSGIRQIIAGQTEPPAGLSLRGYVRAVPDDGYYQIFAGPITGERCPAKIS